MDITDWFIQSAFPTRDEVAEVLGALENAPEGLSLSELCGRVNLSRGRIQKTIDLLSLEAPAPLAKQGSQWQLTPARLSDEFWGRAERLTRLRREEQRQMQDYLSLPFGEHMGFLIEALDGDPTMVAKPALPSLPTGASEKLVREALAFLRRTSLPIEPRRRWPTGGMPLYGVRSNIPEMLRANTGRALCLWGDAGWGGLVRQGKYRDRRFADDLIHACVEMIREWNPQPPPAWVTCVPSLRHPDLVPDFARRLANALGLSFLVVSSDLKKGGTWAGAVEQLDKFRLVPVYFRATGEPSAGLDALRGKGAIPWPNPGDGDAFRAVLDFPAGPNSAVTPEPPALNPGTPEMSIEKTAPLDSSPAAILFDAVREVILPLLKNPMKDTDVAAALDVSNNQAKAWLQRLVDEGMLEKRKRPAGYVLKPRDLFEGKPFC